MFCGCFILVLGLGAMPPGLSAASVAAPASGSQDGLGCQVKLSFSGTAPPRIGRRLNRSNPVVGLAADPRTFVNQSNAMMSCSILAYKRSASCCGPVALEPPFTSNSGPAFSSNAFFQLPTCVGCTPNYWAISLTDLLPCTAGNATFAFSAPDNVVRYFHLFKPTFL